MASLSVLIFAGLLATFLSGGHGQTTEPSLSMQMIPPGPFIKAGESQSIVCIAENFGSGRLVKLEKYQSQAGVRVTLFKQKSIESDYSQVARFSLDVKPVGETGTKFGFFFNITGVLAEDSGEYKCQMSKVNIEESNTLDVIEPATSLEMSVGDKGDQIAIDQEDQELEMSGGKKYIRCDVRGGNPAPRVKITAGDDDLTSKFAVNATKIEHAGEQPGMFRPEAKVEVLPKDPKGVMLGYKYNGKDVTCSAYVQNQEEPVLSRSFRPKFKGARPEFFDCKTPLLAFRNHMNYNITCNFMARPDPFRSVVQYEKRFNANETVTLEPGEVNGHYSSQLKPLDDGNTAYILFIDRLVPQVFRNYTFIVENDMGEAEFTVSLERDPMDTSIDAGSALYTSGALLALLLAIQMIMRS